MSLAINPKKVSAILVGGQWHDVKPGSLDFDAYEYVEPGEERFLVYVHETDRPTLSCTGFVAEIAGMPNGVLIAGSLTMLQAVKYRR